MGWTTMLILWGIFWGILISIPATSIHYIFQKNALQASDIADIGHMQCVTMKNSYLTEYNIRKFGPGKIAWYYNRLLQHFY